MSNLKIRSNPLSVFFFFSFFFLPTVILMQVLLRKKEKKNIRFKRDILLCLLFIHLGRESKSTIDLHYFSKQLWKSILIAFTFLIFRTELAFKKKSNWKHFKRSNRTKSRWELYRLSDLLLVLKTLFSCTNIIKSVL